MKLLKKFLRIAFIIIIGGYSEVCMGVSLRLESESNPTILSIAPSPAILGENITINGTNFTTPVEVFLNGTKITSVYESEIKIRATLPSDLATGIYTIGVSCNSVSVSPSIELSIGPNIKQLNNIIDFTNNLYLEFSGLNNGIDIYSLIIHDGDAKKVYENINYDNKWDGTVTGNGGNVLARGTYYYVLKNKLNAIVRKGYVSVIP